jgi:hypothetical protein
MPEESPDAQVREKPGDFSREIRVFPIIGFPGRDGAMMNQGLPVIEIAPEDMDKIGQFHFIAPLRA